LDSKKGCKILEKIPPPQNTLYCAVVPNGRHFRKHLCCGPTSDAGKMVRDSVLAQNSSMNRRVTTEILYCMSVALPVNNSFVPWLVYSMTFYHIIYYINIYSKFIYIYFESKFIYIYIYEFRK